MSDLSDTQHAVLTAAIARKDRRLYPITAALKGGAVRNVARSLLKRGLVEEVPAGKNTVWRHCEDGTALTLRATKLAGRELAGEDPPTPKPAGGPGTARSPARRPPRPPTPRSAAPPSRRSLLS